MGDINPIFGHYGLGFKGGRLVALLPWPMPSLHARRHKTSRRVTHSLDEGLETAVSCNASVILRLG